MWGGTFAPPNPRKGVGLNARHLQLAKELAKVEAGRLAIAASEAEASERRASLLAAAGLPTESEQVALHLDAILAICAGNEKPFYVGLRMLVMEYEQLRAALPTAHQYEVDQHVSKELHIPEKPGGDNIENSTSESRSNGAFPTDIDLEGRNGQGGKGLIVHATGGKDTIPESEEQEEVAVYVGPYAGFRSSMASMDIPSSSDLKMHIWRFLEQPDGTTANQIFHGLWSAMISVSVCSAIASDLDLSPTHLGALQVIDIFVCILFTMEFITKLIVSGPHRKVFLKNWYTLIDIVVIAQGYMSIFMESSKEPALKLLKTQAPILRLLKIARLSPKWRLLIISMKRCVEPLLIPLYLMVLLVTFCGSLLYWIESNYPDCIVNRRGDPCPNGGDPAFLSILHGMWFVVVTISTVGYGDVYPRSDAGKIINAILIVAGVGYLAMPLAIIGNQFGEVWKDRAVLLVLDKMKTNMGGKIDMAKVKLMFEEHDDGSGSGEIQLEQFEKIVASLDVGLSSRDNKEIFDAIDEDSSGLISLEEFDQFVARH